MPAWPLSLRGPFPVISVARSKPALGDPGSEPSSGVADGQGRRGRCVAAGDGIKGAGERTQAPGTGQVRFRHRKEARASRWERQAQRVRASRLSGWVSADDRRSVRVLLQPLQAQTTYDARREARTRQACRSPTPQLSPVVPPRTSEPGKPKHLRAWRTRGHMTELSHTCETAYNLGS